MSYTRQQSLGKLAEHNCFSFSENIVISISPGSGGPQHQLSSFYLQSLWQKLAGRGHSTKLQSGAATIKSTEKLHFEPALF